MPHAVATATLRKKKLGPSRAVLAVWFALNGPSVCHSSPLCRFIPKMVPTCAICARVGFNAVRPWARILVAETRSNELV